MKSSSWPVVPYLYDIHAGGNITGRREEGMEYKTYTFIYDTLEEINKKFTVDAQSPADASEAFYMEVESEEFVTNYYMVDGE